MYLEKVFKNLLIAQGILLVILIIAELNMPSEYYEINEMIQSLLNKNPELWYSFINTYSQMALSKPDSFKFFFGLITIWFRSVYRKKMEIPDPLHKTELVKNINHFNSKYINAKLLDIVLEIEDVIFAIQQNLYMPLRLTNMILNIQKLLK